jgi:signal transduction histidine kinase
VIEIGEFLRETTGRLAERAEKAGLVLAFEDNAKGPLQARVDRSALEQILVNLVDNACKYAASSEPAIVRIDLEGEDGRARIRVRDHGPGLSPAQRRRLFQPFSKSDREAANSAPGVGLGLALSRRLARAQGGDLRLDDGETSGAAFVVSLPLEEGGK